jgi:hypothetical protein
LINYKNKLHLHAQIGEKIKLKVYAYNITVGSKRKKKDY